MDVLLFNSWVLVNNINPLFFFIKIRIQSPRALRTNTMTELGIRVFSEDVRKLKDELMSNESFGPDVEQKNKKGKGLMHEN